GGRRACGPLDRCWSGEILAPPGMTQTRFRPRRALFDRTAPTGEWRGTPVAGVVNDRNAARVGGVAGHAGLFAPAADVARFAQFMLRQGTFPDGRPLLQAETVRRFTARSAGP